MHFISKQDSTVWVISLHLPWILWGLQQIHSAPNEYDKDIHSHVNAKTNVINLDFLKMLIDLLPLKSLVHIIILFINFVKFLFSLEY